MQESNRNIENENTNNKNLLHEKTEQENIQLKEIYNLKVEKYGWVDEKQELISEISKLNKILYGKHVVNQTQARR